MATPHQFIIIDVTRVYRLETYAVALLKRKGREKTDSGMLVFCGIFPDSPACADLQRGGLKLNFGPKWAKDPSAVTIQNGALAFESRTHALEWCQLQVGHDTLHESRSTMTLAEVPRTSYMTRNLRGLDFDN